MNFIVFTYRHIGKGFLAGVDTSQRQLHIKRTTILPNFSLSDSGYQVLCWDLKIMVICAFYDRHEYTSKPFPRSLL